MELMIRTKQRDYPIIIERGALSRAGELIMRAVCPAGDDGTEALSGSRLFIVTDSGVPDIWVGTLSDQLGVPDLFMFRQGEASKCISVYEDLLKWLASCKASRKDVIVAIGGGVVGDLAGFAAATYMRGIRYINVPTTSLAQIDSGIGGKTAIDLGGIKNIVGAFWQPSMVIVDPDTLNTLPQRELSSGLAEAVKSGLIRDPELFAIFRSDNYMDRLDEIIYRSLLVKKTIVEEDENEASVRKLLNFGHTIGHAYESMFEGRYLHGECVAMGMLKILENEVIKRQLSAVLGRLGLPESCEADTERLTEIIMNDKKAAGPAIDTVQVDEIGRGRIVPRDIEDIRRILK